jgi:hypothetical protein
MGESRKWQKGESGNPKGRGVARELHRSGKRDDEEHRRKQLSPEAIAKEAPRFISKTDCIVCINRRIGESRSSGLLPLLSVHDQSTGKFLCAEPDFLRQCR